MKLKLTFILLFLSGQAKALDYTLDECISMALAKNPDLLKERAVLQEYEAGYSISKAGLLPQLDFALNYQRYDQELPSKKALFGVSQDDYYSEIIFKQNIFAGGKFTSQIDSSRILVESQKKRISLIEKELILNITKAYYEQVRASYFLEIQKTLLEKLSAQRIIAELLYKGGKTSIVDVLRIQTNESAQSDIVANAENQAYIKELNLGQTIGVESPIKAKSSLPQINENVVFEKEIPADILNSHPEILFSSLSKEKNFVEIKTAKSLRYPSLYFKASYFMEDKTFFPGNSNSYGGLFLSLPIYNGGSISAQIEKARSKYLQSLEVERKTRLNLYSRYSAAVATALDKKDRIFTAAKTLELAKETLTASELNYSSGKISVIDLLDAQKLWSNASLSYANAALDYLISIAELKYIWTDGVKGDVLK